MNMSLSQFLVFLASSGGAAVVFSFVAERIADFQKLTSDQRSYVILAGSIILAAGAYAVMAFVPQDNLAAAAPWFQVVAGVIATWLATQGAHQVDPIA